MSIRISALDGMVVFLYVLIFGALWRWGATCLAKSDNELFQKMGGAMSNVY